MESLLDFAQHHVFGTIFTAIAVFAGPYVLSVPALNGLLKDRRLASHRATIANSLTLIDNALGQVPSYDESFVDRLIDAAIETASEGAVTPENYPVFAEVKAEVLRLEDPRKIVAATKRKLAEDSPEFAAALELIKLAQRGA